ncbi:unnamed protein product [Agarophyton chilense]
MEKYRSTSDPSTGIHPFIPPTTNIFSPPLRPILTLLRLPIFLLLFVPYSLLNTLLFLLPSILSYPLRRILDKLFLPYILLSLSVLPTYATLEQPRVRDAARGKHPSRFDIILINVSSPIDILLVSFSYSPTFAIASSQDPTLLHSLTLLQAFTTISLTPPHPTSAPKPPQALLGNGPLCVLAEGCSTNGKGVLRFSYKLHTASIPEPCVIYAAGISRTSKGSACRTTQSLSKTLLHAVGEWKISPRIRVSAVPREGGDHQASVAALAGVPALKIGHETAQQFAQHWKQTCSSSRTSSSKAHTH